MGLFKDFGDRISGRHKERMQKLQLEAEKREKDAARIAQAEAELRAAQAEADRLHYENEEKKAREEAQKRASNERIEIAKAKAEADKTPLEVELLFDKEIATYATNRIWHSNQILEEREDGSVYLKFKTTQKQELLRFILGQGHMVKVLGPKELVEEVKEELQRTENMYK